MLEKSTPAMVGLVRSDSKLRSTPLVTGGKEVDVVTGNALGSWGIKFDYLQKTPAANIPPINYKQYKNLLVFDEFAKWILSPKEEGCADEMIRQNLAPAMAPKD